MHEKNIVRPRWITVYESELFALLVAVMYAVDNKRDALIISDSKSALQLLNKEKALHKNLVNKIQKQLTHCRNNGQKIMFMQLPSHVGITGNETKEYHSCINRISWLLYVTISIGTATVCCYSYYFVVITIISSIIALPCL